MRTHTISSLSLEYVKVPVSGTESGDTIDVSGLTVRMAFVAIGAEPVAGDWKTASVETADGRYLARCLVGPAGTVTLADGTYQPWIEITDSPEVVKRPAAGYLKVT